MNIALLDRTFYIMVTYIIQLYTDFIGSKCLTDVNNRIRTKPQY